MDMKDTRKNVLCAVMIFAVAFVVFTLITMISMGGTFWAAVCTPIPWIFAMICGSAGFVVRENNVNFDRDIATRVYQ